MGYSEVLFTRIKLVKQKDSSIVSQVRLKYRYWKLKGTQPDEGACLIFTDAEPPELPAVHVEEQQLYSVLLPGAWARHSISNWDEVSHPAKETHFNLSYQVWVIVTHVDIPFMQSKLFAQSQVGKI